MLQKNRSITKRNGRESDTFREDDIYGLFKEEVEVDSDVNEDANREWLLDQSLSSFLESLEE